MAQQDAGKKHLPRSVLDIGGDSGILSIAALQLRAARVLAIEIDAVAVQAARRNIAINLLAHAVQLLKTSWQDVSGQFDLVLSNPVPSVMCEAAPYIAKLLRKKGLLITAGFPLSKIENVPGLFAKHGLRLRYESSPDGCYALLRMR